MMKSPIDFHPLKGRDLLDDTEACTRVPLDDDDTLEQDSSLLQALAVFTDASERRSTACRAYEEAYLHRARVYFYEEANHIVLAFKKALRSNAFVIVQVERNQRTYLGKADQRGQLELNLCPLNEGDTLTLLIEDEARKQIHLELIYSPKHPRGCLPEINFESTSMS